MFPGGKQIDDKGLGKKLKKASSKPMTKAERTEQRISFVYGQIAHKDGRTKEEIERSLREQGLI